MHPHLLRPAILLLATVLGEVVRRFRFPRVIGEFVLRVFCWDPPCLVLFPNPTKQGMTSRCSRNSPASACADCSSKWAWRPGWLTSRVSGLLLAGFRLPA